MDRYSCWTCGKELSENGVQTVNWDEEMGCYMPVCSDCIDYMTLHEYNGNDLCYVCGDPERSENHVHYGNDL